MDCDTDVTIFTGCFYKLNTPETEKINRSEFGEGTDFEQDVGEDIAEMCYIPTSGFCFIKRIEFLTSIDFEQLFLYFIRDKIRRINVLKKARFQPFCIAHSISIRYFNGKKVYLRSVTEKSKACYSYRNLNLKSDGVDFKKAIAEIKSKVTIVANSM